MLLVTFSTMRFMRAGARSTPEGSPRVPVTTASPGGARPEEALAPTVPPDLVAWYAEGFSDRVGDRLLLFDNTGPALELLRLNPRLASVPGFEAALRARVEDLKTFDHPIFARVRCVTTLDDPSAQLALVSELVDGERLSQLLQAAEREALRPPPSAAVWLIRQLLPAMAALHAQCNGIAHGLLGADRVVVTPDGGMAVTEYVLADGIERLGLSVADLWRQFGIAAREGPGGPVLDAGSDLTQIGLLALSVLLGRPLAADEYPGKLSALLDEACSSRHWSLSPLLRPWLARAFGIDATPFKSFDEAQSELETLLPGVAGKWSQRLLPRAEGPGRAAPRSFTTPEAARVPNARVAPARTSPATSGGPVPPPRPPRAAGESVPRGARAGEQHSARVPGAADAPSPVRQVRRLRRLLAVTGLVACAEAAALVIIIAQLPHREDSTSAVQLAGLIASPGKETARTERASAPAARPAPQPSSLAAGAGWIAIRSEVSLDVYADGELLGSALTGRFQLAAGEHQITLLNPALGFRMTQRVQLRAGRTVSFSPRLAREP